MDKSNFTEKLCVDCRWAMDNTIWPNLFATKIVCDKGYSDRFKLSNACTLFEAGEYEPEIERNATI